jgi:hypothetical protein
MQILIKLSTLLHFKCSNLEINEIVAINGAPMLPLKRQIPRLNKLQILNEKFTFQNLNFIFILAPFWNKLY